MNIGLYYSHNDRIAKPGDTTVILQNPIEYSTS